MQLHQIAQQNLTLNAQAQKSIKGGTSDVNTTTFIIIDMDEDMG